MDETLEESYASLQPLADLQPLNRDQEIDYYATIGELLEAEMITVDEAANYIFGPDPTPYR